MRAGLAAFALAALLALLLAAHAYSQSFSVYEEHWRNRVGGHSVYPGSRDATLTVTVQYTGNETITGVVACLNHPPYITPSDGYSLCASAETPGGLPAAEVNPGDYIVFTFHVDIASDAPTGWLQLPVYVSYRVAATGETRTEPLPGIGIYISPYPAPRLAPLQVYWEPGGYPGTEDATLRVVLENSGPSVLSGLATLTLPNHTFYPAVLHAQVPGVASGHMLLLSFTPISINTSAAPGEYVAWLKLRLSMETEDGVRYTAYEEIRLDVPVERPPGAAVEIIDYGVEGLAAPGTRGAYIYVTLLNRDPGLVVRAAYATLVLIRGAVAANGTSVLYASSTAETGYGRSLTLVFGPVDVESEAIRASLHLELLVSRNGADYWVELDKLLEIRPRWEPGLTYLGAEWSTGVAYPGSTADLEVHVGIAGYERVAGGVAVLTLPRGFEPRRVSAPVPAAASGGVLTLRFPSVSVQDSTEPGVYECNLTLRLLLVDARSGARRNATITMPVLVRVSKPPAPPLRVVAVYWASGPAYSGSAGNTIEVLLLGAEPGTRVTGGYVVVRLPPGLAAPQGRVVNLTLPSLAYGGTATLRISGVSIDENVHGELPLYVSIVGYAVHGGASYKFSEAAAAWLAVRRPRLNLTLAGYSWVGLAAPGSSGARLRVVLYDYSLDEVQQLRVEWRFAGAEPLGPTVEVLGVNAGHGSSIVVESPPLVVNETRVRVELLVTARLVRDGVSYTASRTISFYADAASALPAPRLANVEVIYSGSPALLAPGEEGVVLRLRLVNPTSVQLTSIYASLIAPYTRVEAVGGTCLGGVAPGSTCTLDFTLNVSPAAPPGIYHALIVLTYMASAAGSVASYHADYNLTLRLVAPSSLAPRLRLVSLYWGAGRPQPVYPYAGITPVTVVVVNEGRWEARGVEVSLSVKAEGIEPVVDHALCAAALAPGASCAATLYYRVGGVKPGAYEAVVEIRQVVYTYGLDVPLTTLYRAGLRVYQPPMGGGLRLLAHRWENEWPVYPNTSGAILEVTIANLEPYPLRGILLRLDAPPGFNAHRAYIAGPVQPYAEVTAAIRVDVGGVKPGCYPAILEAVYALDTPGYAGSSEAEWRIELCVSNPDNAFSIVKAYWAGGSVGPDTPGATLVIVLRDEEVPRATGIVARVELPPGMRSATTNATVAVAVAALQPPQLPAGQTAPAIEQLLRLASQGGGVEQQVATKGSFVVLRVPVNLYGVKPGAYHVGVEIDYIDAWGSRHVYRGSVTIHVLGAPKVVEARLPPLVNVTGGYANATLRIENIGSGPIYDVYVYLVPRLPLLLPQPAVIYIPVLKPREPVEKQITLYYNPAGIPSWSQGGSNPGYAAVPFTIGIVYRDAAGMLHAFNYSGVVQVAPFILLRLGPDTRATYRSGVLTVGGTVVNLGTATARSVEVIVYAGGKSSSTVIGDIDPGDQAAFRVDLRLAKPPTRVKLVVKYLDDYNRVYSFARSLPVVVEGAPKPRLESRSGAAAGIHPALYAAPLAAAAAAAAIFAVARRVRR